MELKTCQKCGSVIPFNPKKGIKNYVERKYCSKACAEIHKFHPRSKPHPERFKPCEVCGNIIPKEPNRNWNIYAKKRFCSERCMGIARMQGDEVTCEVCGKVFHRSPALIRGRVFCSHACRHKKQEYTCEICGKKFIRHPSERVGAHVYCGKDCQGIAKRKNKPQSQGRRSPEDLAWKAAVLKRDGYHCQHCGTNHKLEAHHIREVKDFPELRHDISNGQTLCHDCHYYGVHGGKPNFIHGRYSKQHSQILAQQEPA